MQNQQLRSHSALGGSSETTRPLLDDRDVARLTGRARSSLQKDRLYGGGIPFIRLGRLVRYRPADVDAWLASRPTLRSTSDAAAGRADR